MTAAPPAIASWTRPSDIYTLTIKKGGKVYGLESGFQSFSYYESIFSPHVSANLAFIDTGFAVQEGTLMNALQVTGNEEVAVLINHPSGSLDFDDSTQHFLVDKITDHSGANQQAKLTSLRLVSKYEKKNKIAKVEGAYDNNIRNSFQSILTSKLGVPTSKLSLENTQNSLSFKGNGRTPFDIGLFLAPRSRPVSGAPGFLFYETQSGFNFKSLNSLIATSGVGHYTSKGVAAGGENQHSSCRIIKHVYIKKPEVSAIESSGLLRNRTTYFNPLTQEISSDVWNMDLNSSAFANLGAESFSDQSANILDSLSTVDYNLSSDDNMTTFYKFFDTGNNAASPFPSYTGISTACNNIIQEINNDPRLFQAMAVMRYHSLLTEIIDMVIPCNMFLKAGHVIECEFKKHSGTVTSASPNDEWESGKYLIMHLSHKFNQHGDMGSTTHLRVARDTRGLYSP